MGFPRSAAQERMLIGDMQREIEDIFRTQAREAQRPNCLYRIGCFADSTSQALDRGVSNFRELVMLHGYLTRQEPEGKTSLDYLMDPDREIDPDFLASDEAHRAEFALIQWLGSNVGISFVREMLDRIETLN